MLKVVQIDLANRKQVRDFLHLPPCIYRDTPQWVPALEGEERLRLTTRSINTPQRDFSWLMKTTSR
jgi:hypothetical protein